MLPEKRVYFCVLFSHDNEPNYAYQEKPVRGKKRKALPGQTCNKCDEVHTSPFTTKK